MAYKIDEKCTACDACVPVCPVNAISKGEPIYKIDPAVCNDCADLPDGPKCIPVCPVDAIARA